MSDDQEQMVPISRLNKQIETIKTLNAQIEALQRDKAELEARAEKIGGSLLGYKQMAEDAKKEAAEVGALKQQLQDIEAKHADDLAMMRAGITDEDAIDFARIKYGKAGTDKAFKDWIAEITASDPPAWTGISRSDAQPAEAQEGKPAQQQQAAAPPPKPNAKPAPAPASSEIDPFKIGTMSDEEFEKHFG